MWRILGAMERRPPFPFLWKSILGGSLKRIRRKLTRRSTIQKNKMSLFMISGTSRPHLNSKIVFWVPLVTGKRYGKNCWIHTLKNSNSQTMWSVLTANKVSGATTRCEYCGPHQYFCVGCARALHGSRNKFHVLEQWKVSMKVINVFLSVAFS